MSLSHTGKDREERSEKILHQRQNKMSRRKAKDSPNDLIRKVNRIPGNKVCADCPERLPQVNKFSLSIKSDQPFEKI